MQEISTCLWFDDQAEAAVKFYTSVFKDSKVLGTTYYTLSAEPQSGKKAGDILTIEFELNGHPFVALNGGPVFRFTEAVSMVVNCETQAQVDDYWEKLSAGGKVVECGWLKDKFGLSWQVVPTLLNRLLQDPDRERVERVMGAMLKMKKLDVKKLKEAYENH